ncbi:MAG: hypothetical protein ABWU13_03215 [Limnospira maxima]|uniref:hypothetical protein n=1 Tax=Limnospira indica TaxID=147322 RepID=UPI000316D828|nr:hypothetical protein [Limnospira indica]
MSLIHSTLMLIPWRSIFISPNLLKGDHLPVQVGITAIEHLRGFIIPDIVNPDQL